MSASLSRSLLDDRDYERDRKDGALDRPVARITAVVLLVVIVVAFTTAGLVTRYELYKKKTSVTLGAGDVWSVSIQKSSVFSGVFCAGYNVQATKPEVLTSQASGGSEPVGIFSVIALSAKARMAKGQVRRNIHDRGLLGTYALNRYFIYHLPQSGNISVTACSNQTDVAVAVCENEDGARKFIKNGPNSGACDSKTCSFKKCGEIQTECHIFAKQTGNSEKMQPIISVVYRTSGHDTGGESVQVNFDIINSVYELDTKDASCDNASNSCILPVPITAADVILQVPVNTNMNPTHLEGFCSARVPIYMCIFVGLPLALILVTCGCALCLTKAQASVIKVTNHADRTREYRSLGSRQDDLERSGFLSPKSQQPPPPAYQLCPEDTHIQASRAEHSVVM